MPGIMDSYPMGSNLLKYIHLDLSHKVVPKSVSAHGLNHIVSYCIRISNKMTKNLYSLDLKQLCGSNVTRELYDVQ